MLNIASSKPGVRAVIDALVDRAPELLDERKVLLDQALMQPDMLSEAKKMLQGANTTNVLGAFTAIYNARVAADIKRIGSLKNGPFGELAGVAVVVGESLIGPDKTPNMIGLMEILSKHLSNISAAFSRG